MNLFAKLRAQLGGDSETPPLVLFSRDQGPVCYQRVSLNNQSFFQGEFVDCLFACGLEWFWASRQTRPLAQWAVFSGLPESRPLTRLERKNVDLLVQDRGQENEDSYGRELVLIGAGPGSSTALGRIESFRKALAAFVEDAQPIRVIIYAWDDSPFFNIFVSQKADQFLLNFTNTIGLKPAASEQRPYKQLGRESLEHTNENIVSLAFPDDASLDAKRLVP